MANSVSVRSSVFVQFVANDQGQNPQNLVANPVSVLANRSYNLCDFTVCVVTGSGDGAGVAPNVNQARILIDEYSAAGAPLATLGTVAAVAANNGTYRRPAATATAAVGAAPTDALLANAVVARGNLLRLSAVSSGAGVATDVRAYGTVRVLPGNRYGAATASSAYFANNSASGAQGSNATVSI
jgi:hypothetical protein